MDRDGWRSKGTAVRCPKCGEDDATLIETRIYDRVTHVIYCSVCAYHPRELPSDPIISDIADP